MSSVHLINGFDPSKMANFVILRADCKKYGINPDDFAKVDVDHRGDITMDEFLQHGMGYASIFSVFKTQAEQRKAYSDPGTKNNESVQNKNTVQGMDNPMNSANLSALSQNKSFFGNSSQKNNLYHPSIAGHQSLGHNFDYSV